jgi:hypothetical protein
MLADARRVLEIAGDTHPFMDAERRRAICGAKRIAWATIAEVAEQLGATLDTAAGDPDLESADPPEYDDPSGGNVTGEPHEAGTEDGA